ncbi:hypothetical protein NE237_005778 [Protea cynaroides]|uniref:Uncharacterized protein n=1 Tax=Protea cynaroides TaxID=273540 RepID=A0A9Q0KLC2_9MAGN|nr:hypothetical protein NE237_005778 [Protea cynaroides]
MAEEGTIISFAKKLGVIVLEEYKFLEGVEGESVSLRDKLEWISSFLRDATVQRSKYERVDVWDVLDIFIHKVKKLKKHKRLGNQIKSINKRIKNISTRRSKYAIDKLEDKDSLSNDTALSKRRDPDEEGDNVVGFDGQSKVVAKMLLEKEDDSSQFHVISIVGMAGAGKSTLARKVYNDVKNQFDSCAWINEAPNKEDMGKLLIVLDDVWRRQDWDALHSDVLKKIKSAEIRSVTSRYTAVATRACSRIKPYDIEKLDEEMGLELLKKKVFRKENLPGELKELAVKIVEKCHGLTLAIAVLGGLLSTKQKTIDMWTKVLQSVSLQLLQGSTECFNALSYDNVPNFLKPCFLYLGLFPEDSLIDCKTLIQLWIAEGFIQMRGEESMEARMNMIQVDKRRSNGSVEILRQDKFLDIFGNHDWETHCTMSRRVAVHSTKGKEKEGTQIPDSSSLNDPRSMLCFHNLSNIRPLEDKSFYKSFKLLRVLGTLTIKRLPSSIHNLQNLRTLDINGTGIIGIPGSIFELEELRYFYGNTDIYSWRDTNDNVFSCTLHCKIVDYYHHSGIGGALPPRISRLRKLYTLQ